MTDQASIRTFADIQAFGDSARQAIDRLARRIQDAADAPAGTRIALGLQVVRGPRRLALQEFGDAAAQETAFRIPLVRARRQDGFQELEVELPGIPAHRVSILALPELLRIEAAADGQKYRLSWSPEQLLDPARVAARMDEGLLRIRLAPARVEASPKRLPQGGGPQPRRTPVHPASI